LDWDVSKIYRSGTSPLFYAFLSGNESLIKYLLKGGAYINITDDTLFSACKSRSENLVKYLIEQRADIHKEGDEYINKGETPLFKACKEWK